jgi:hypothetical protein
MSWDLTISSAADPLLDAFEPWLMSFVEDMVSSTYVYPGHYFYPLQQVRVVITHFIGRGGQGASRVGAAYPGQHVSGIWEPSHL